MSEEENQPEKIEPNISVEPVVEVAPENISATETAPSNSPEGGEPETVTISETVTPPLQQASAGQANQFPARTTEADKVVQSGGDMRSLLPKLREKLASRTEKRLNKIIELAKEKAKIGESIRNDDVEKLLHVSHASATNYLHELVQRGNLKASGPRTHSKYSPN